jgi:hypothetical protein
MSALEEDVADTVSQLSVTGLKTETNLLAWGLADGTPTPSPEDGDGLSKLISVIEECC